MKISREKLVKLYDSVGSYKKVAEALNLSKTKTFNLMKGHNITSHPRRYDCNHALFSEDNEVSFYLAGFIAADGCVKDTYAHSKMLEIRLADKDTSHLKLIKKLLQAENPLHKWSSKQSTGYSLQMSSDQICDDLLNRFGIGPRKSLTHDMPKRLINHPLVNHFIRGYNDGDGCFHKPKQVVIFTMAGTYNFLSKVRDIFAKKFNFDQEKYLYPKGKIHRLQCADILLVNDIISFLYRNASIYLDRKYQIAKLAAQTIPNAKVGITADVVKSIRNKRTLGWTLEKISNHFGISETHISRIVNHKLY